MFKAEDIMTKKVITVLATTPIYDALNIFIQKQVSGLPVVDEGGNLVGIITEKDVLELLLYKSIQEKASVGDFMTRIVKHFNREDSALDVCEFLLQNPIRRVPITDGEKVVGIVSRRDIISLILKIRGKVKKAGLRKT